MNPIPILVRATAFSWVGLGKAVCGGFEDAGQSEAQGCNGCDGGERDQSEHEAVFDHGRATFWG